MSELHWAGTAVLLALAVVGHDWARPRRATIVSWAEFAREHKLDADPSQTEGADQCPSAWR